MSINFEEILKELEYRVEHGIIDLTKEEQVTKLTELLREHKVSDANEMAQKVKVYFSYLKEISEASAKKPKQDINKVLNKTFTNPETGNLIKVASGLGYDKKSQAYKTAKAMFTGAGFDEKDIDMVDAGPDDEEIPVKGKTSKGATKKPTTPAADIDVTSAEKKKAGTDKDKETKEKPKPSRRINPDEGEVVKELSDKEMDSIIEKYVSVGEPTPDEMGEMVKNYAKQDMAETHTDEIFYSQKNRKELKTRKPPIQIRQSPYKIDSKTRNELVKNGFPEKYIKFLERCINTQVKGKKPPVTDLIKQGGAGQIQSQFGEVMAMAFMSMRNPSDRKKLAEILNSEIKKSAEEFGGGKASAIATTDWVEASLTHAEAFDSAMDEKYGKGRWIFQGAAWDIKDDVESLGLDYKNKGFSTDVMLRVQPIGKNGKPDGPARAQKCSLKKDEAIFFFNGSINEVNNFVLNYIDEKSRKRVKGYEAIVSKSKSKIPEERAAAIQAAERITGIQGSKAIEQLKNSANSLREEAFNKAPKDIQKSITTIREFPNKQLSSAIDMAKKLKTDVRNVNSAIDSMKDIGEEDKEFAKISYDIVKKCKGSKDTNACIVQQLEKRGEETTGDRVCKVSVLAARIVAANGDKSAKSMLDKHYDLATQSGNALMTILPDSPELMGGLMQKLAEAFPMKTCMQGEEFMLIDGMKVTQKTLQSVFGVQSYEELEQGLKLKKMPNGEYVLVYGAKNAKGKDIPIGIVGARQKGKGYVGSVGFEIACSDDFAYAIAEANERNGDQSESNKKALKRIGSTLEKRKSKKK